MNTHRFTPSRPDGTVCVAAPLPGYEVCGFPAGHPIHKVPEAADALEHGYQREIDSLTARMAAALVQLKHLRTAIVEHGAACYRRGRADGVGMISAAQTEQQATLAANEKITGLVSGIAKTLTTRASATPAEARTGISDRTAAALADVAEMRSALGTFDAGGLRDDDGLFAALDRIEQALRAGGVA